MREGLFIKKNKERWERIQQQLPVDPDELASDFIRLVDDLSYAKTFYPQSKVSRLINSMASRIYLDIYKTRKEDSNRLLRFWKYDVPLTMYKRRKAVIFSFLIFILFFSVGFFSSFHDPEFVRQVLGNDYVNTTEKNIANGNPFGIYQGGNAFAMWMYIMLNNILVSFTYFLRGILLGIPSFFSLGKESIRLGAFEQIFYAKGLGLLSVTTVLIHGMLELTAIIISCAAGFIMGTGFLFPGTGSRLMAFRESTKDGIRLVIGLIPIFIIAAFFEGYVTRYYRMPLALNLTILVTAAVFITWYFILYPAKLSRKNEG